MDAALPVVLADLALSSRATGEHQPVSYGVHVATAEIERWAQVDCTCGAHGRIDWLPGTTADYRALLHEAWSARGCSST